MTDPQGSVIMGASVDLERADTGFHSAHTTDKSGAYEFLQVPPGTYTLTVQSSGFRKQVATVPL